MSKGTQKEIATRLKNLAMARWNRNNDMLCSHVQSQRNSKSTRYTAIGSMAVNTSRQPAESDIILRPLKTHKKIQKIILFMQLH